MSGLDDLVRRVNELFEDITVTAHDFQRPTPFFFRSIFSRLMEEYQVDINNVNKFQMQECSPEDIDILGDLNFLVALREVFPFLNIGIFDILYPEAKKTIDAFSKAFNYYEFCDDRLMQLNERVKDHVRAKKTLTETLKRKQLISQKINEVAIEKDDYDRQLIDLKNQAKEKETVLRGWQSKILAMKNEGKLLKTKEEELDSNISALEQTILHLKSSNNKLEKSIVNNPEVEQHKLKSKEMEWNKIKEKRAAIYEKLKQKSEYKRQLLQISSSLTKVLEGTQVFDLIRLTESKKNNLARLKNELSSLTFREKKDKDIVALTAQIENEEISLKEMRNELTTKQSALISSVEEAKRSYSKAMAKRSQDQNKHADSQNELTLLNKREEELNNMMVSHIKTFNGVIEYYEKHFFEK